MEGKRRPLNKGGAVIDQKTQHSETVIAPTETSTAPAAVTAAPAVYMQTTHGEKMVKIMDFIREDRGGSRSPWISQ